MNISEIKDEIYGSLHDAISDTNIANDIYDQVETLDTAYIEQYKEIRRYWEKAFEKSTEKIREIEQASLQQKSAFRNATIVRQSLNKLFSIYYQKNRQDIANLNYQEMISKFTHLFRKNPNIEKEGVRYALSVIDDKCNGMSKDLCIYFIRLNQSFHPPIKPLNVILSSIEQLKFFKSVNASFKPCDTDLSIKVLEEIEETIKENSKLFE